MSSSFAADAMSLLQLFRSTPPSATPARFRGTDAHGASVPGEVANREAMIMEKYGGDPFASDTGAAEMWALAIDTAQPDDRAP